MKIPPEFIISEKDAVLGTTTSNGLKKHGLDPPAKMGRHNEFLALINGYKPIIGANEEKLRERIKKYHSLELYVRSIKVYMLDGRFWIDKKENKRAILFTIFNKKEFLKNLYDCLEGLDRSVVGFAFHYIIGTLYGYRKSSIRGYYLSMYIKKESDWETFKESKQYKIYRRDYHRMVKICNEWIEYMLNDSKEFKKYVKEKEKEIKLFKV